MSDKVSLVDKEDSSSKANIHHKTKEDKRSAPINKFSIKCIHQSKNDSWFQKF